MRPDSGYLMLLLLLIWTIVVTLCQAQWQGSGCYYEQCIKRLNRKFVASWSSCRALQRGFTCLTTQSKLCRGDLLFSQYVAVVKKAMKENNCSAVLSDLPNEATDDPDSDDGDDEDDDADGSADALPSTTPEPFINLPEYHGCSTIELSHDMVFCSIFGDPHVITHGGDFQTCDLTGAYPFIDNPYLAIQVSSQTVTRSRYPATVSSVSRVTVIIKGTDCSRQRQMYEATLHPFATVLKDGGSESDTVKLVERIPNSLMEIRILHIKTIIFIRQIGQYLSVAVRLPRSLVEMDQATTYQLCSAGCPRNKIQSRPEVIGHVSSRPLDQAQQHCGRHNLTAPFKESCLFDYALTEDTDLIMMSRDAQLDWEHLAPLGQMRTVPWTANGQPYLVQSVRNCARHRSRLVPFLFLLSVLFF